MKNLQIKGNYSIDNDVLVTKSEMIASGNVGYVCNSRKKHLPLVVMGGVGMGICAGKNFTDVLCIHKGFLILYRLSNRHGYRRNCFRVKN